MAIVRAQVVLSDIGGLPEDRYMHTWHFNTATAPIAQHYTDMASALSIFYVNDVSAPEARDIESYLAGHIADAPDPVVNFYIMPGGGSPVATRDITPFAVNDAKKPLPSEVCVALSFHADLTGVAEEVPQPPAGPAGDLRPRARRRGRIYLGPLNEDASFASAGQHARPDGIFRVVIRKAAERLRDDATLAADLIDWAVYSPTDGVARPVVGGWIDDAFDTQRRRGVDKTSRTLLT